MKKIQVSVGDVVTVKTRVEGYYSGYGMILNKATRLSAPAPAYFLEPGVRATVEEVDVPGERAGQPPVCMVRWLSSVTKKQEKAAIAYDNIVVLGKSEPAKPAAAAPAAAPAKRAARVR